jgi:uncharacterized glyoxalase superfamily protein PhnB
MTRIHSYYGGLKDKFGVMWMVDYRPPRDQ